MQDESDGRAAAASRRPRAAACMELLATAALFAAWGAWPAPDVNEAVYLTKARHAADPAWGRGDFFLETADAHPVFYLLVGPLAARVPLEQAAWIGRILGWAALAVGFRHAVLPLLAAAPARLAAAAAFALALEQTTAAGEWVIGGCEAKVYAWAFVLGAVGECVRGRFAGAACLMGAATALHPVVGGWGFVAAAGTWLFAARPRVARPAPVAVGLVAVGLGLALVGVVPALGLSAGADAALRAVGARIHVVERLPHHLLPRGFAAGMTARHVLAAIAWWLLARTAPATPARSRLDTFTLVSLAIALAGHAIALAEPWAPAPVHGILRYYWFRLADVTVAFALATATVAVLADDAVCRRVLPCAPRAARLGAGLLLAAAALLQAWHWPLPGRIPPVMPRADAKVEAAAWADVCRWVRDHVPADACFLTPRGAASFGWRTGRREVVSWKNSPQDAAALVAWRERIVDCFSRDGGIANLERSTAAIGPERMRVVAVRYGADHAIVPVELALTGLPGERLYANDRYVVFRLAP